MAEFYVTFGAQYTERNIQHPQGMNADGYYVIEASDEVTARDIAFELFNRKWSMLYTKQEWDMSGFEENARWYPLGELGRTKEDDDGRDARED